MLAKYVVPLALASVFVITSISQADGEPRSFAGYSRNQPLIFTHNDGQWDEQVRFRANVNDATMWFVNDGFYCQFVREVSDDPAPSQGFDQRVSRSENLIIKATIVGASESVDVMGERLTKGTHNYFLGSDPSRWRTGVPNYETILYREIYPGIDLRYYYNGAKMEYDFILSPGADPSQIQIRYEGTEAITINESGDLEIATAWGTVTQTCPVIYQQDGAGRYELEGRYEPMSDNSIGFAVSGRHDPARKLIIDPVIMYSSYLSGSSVETALDITLDSYGNDIVVGISQSADFPVVDPIQGTLNGTTDIFITKMDLITREMLYSTYFGGSAGEGWPSVAVDAQDNIYVFFSSYSDNVPTVHPFQSDLNGTCDAFVLKLNPDGDELLVATYLGGDGVEYTVSCDVDDQQMIYVLGETDSRDFPVVNAFADEFGGGELDGFVAKLDAAGDALIYATYLGGRKGEAMRKVLVNELGEAYVVGATYSTNFPAVNSLYECMINAEGPADAIVTKFSATGETLVFSTFLGGTEDEVIQDIEFDADGNLVLAGYAESYDYPTVNAIQWERCAEDEEVPTAVVTIMANDASEILYSTYFGGCGMDFGKSVVVGPDNKIYVSGWTFSDDFPVLDAFDSQLEDTVDAFVFCLDPISSELIYSTYYGGTQRDYARAMVIDEYGWLHITGYTLSADLPLVLPMQTTTAHYGTSFVLWMKSGCCRLRTGNFDGDEDNLVDILDLDFAVGYFFRGGDEPACEAEGDVDISGRIDIEDIVYMVAYLFRLGPEPPVCPD